VDCEEAGAGALPVSGPIPDMFSDSERYIALQNVYRQKAQQDADWVLARTRQLLEEIGRPSESISESFVRLFCKEAYHLRVVRTGCSLANEAEGKSPNLAEVASHFEMNPDSSAIYYYVLRGVDRFRAEFSAVPGNMNDDSVEPDIGKLKTCVNKVVAEAGLSASSVLQAKDDCIHEVCRYGGAELHAVAAIVGANAAQECVKLITGQYVPVDNLFIYDALKSETVTLKV